MLALYKGHNDILKYLLSKGFKASILVQGTRSAKLVNLVPFDIRDCPNEICPWDRREIFQPSTASRNGIAKALIAWQEGIVLRERRIADWSKPTIRLAGLSSGITRKYEERPQDHMLLSPRLVISIIKSIREEMHTLASKGLYDAALSLMELPDLKPMGQKVPKIRSIAYISRDYDEGAVKGKKNNRLELMRKKIRLYVKHYEELKFSLRWKASQIRETVREMRREMLEGIARTYWQLGHSTEKRKDLKGARDAFMLAFQLWPEVELVMIQVVRHPIFFSFQESERGFYERKIKKDLKRITKDIEEKDPMEFDSSNYTEVVEVFDRLVQVQKRRGQLERIANIV